MTYINNFCILTNIKTTAKQCFRDCSRVQTFANNCMCQDLHLRKSQMSISQLFPCATTAPRHLRCSQVQSMCVTVFLTKQIGPINTETAMECVVVQKAAKSARSNLTTPKRVSNTLILFGQHLSCKQVSTERMADYKKIIKMGLMYISALILLQFLFHL